MTSAGLVELVGRFCTSCEVTVVVGLAAVATGAAWAAVARPVAIAKVDDVNASPVAVEYRRMYSTPLVLQGLWLT
jgi:hypothetical protein